MTGSVSARWRNPETGLVESLTAGEGGRLCEAVNFPNLSDRDAVLAAADSIRVTLIGMGVVPQED